LPYHITTGIGIGTRIGIGARKKYRVSEVSVNPGIGLSLNIIKFKSQATKGRPVAGIINYIAYPKPSRDVKYSVVLYQLA